MAHIVLFCIKFLRIAWVNVLNLKINGADFNVIKNVMMQNIISFSFDFGVKWFTPHSDCTCTQVLDWCAAQWDYIMLRASLKVACGWRERDVNAGDSKRDGGLFMEDANALVWERLYEVTLSYLKQAHTHCSQTRHTYQMNSLQASIINLISTLIRTELILSLASDLCAYVCVIWFSGPE